MCRWAVSRRRIMSWVGNWRSWQTAWTNRRASIIARCDHRDEEEINQINKQRAIDSQIFTQLNVKDGEIRQLLEKITSQREAYRDLMQVSHHIFIIFFSLHFTINQHHITIRGLWDLLQQGLCQMLWKSCSKNSHPGQTKVHPVCVCTRETQAGRRALRREVKPRQARDDPCLTDVPKQRRHSLS